MLETTSAIIMASGCSKRMGQNKLFLTYKNQTLLELTLQLALNAGFYEVILVIRPEDYARISVPDKVIVVLNNKSKLGQSVSVRIGTKKAKGSGYLFLTVDQPLLTVAILEKIVDQGMPNRIVFATGDGIPSSPVFFGADFREELLALTGENGGRSVRDAHPEACIPVAVPPRFLQDMDTPEDYAKLLKEMS